MCNSSSSVVDVLLEVVPVQSSNLVGGRMNEKRMKIKKQDRRRKKKEEEEVESI